MFVKMFQSSNNGNVDPINYSDYNRLPFFNDITSNFKHDEDQFPNFSFFHLPNTPLSLSYDQLELQDDFIFHQTDDFSLHHHHQQQQQQQPFTTVVADTKEKPKICNGESNIPRKRSSKRDRHSKITTAQGPRDRRMRLSLKVAREFFDLQDKLCFDKASKTVEWLLIQSRPAIKKLNCTGLGNYSCCTVGASSTSECEVVSGIDEAAVANIKGSKNRKSNNNPTSKKKSKPPSRKSTFHPSAKESREKARARARERTRKKQWNRNQLSSWSPNGEESATQSHTINNNNNNCMEILGAEIEEAPISSHDQRCVTTQAVIDDSLVIKWSPSLNINHMYHTQEVTNHQITDLQSFCKSWEVTSYNS